MYQAYSKKTIPRQFSLSSSRSRQAVRLLVLLMAGTGALIVSDARAQQKSPEHTEYEVKSAFVYNFLKFMTWPEDKSTDEQETATDENNTFTVGVLGQCAFECFNTFLNGKTIGKKQIRVVQLSKKDIQLSEGQAGTPAFKVCQVLFFSAEVKMDFGKVLTVISGDSILTIGEMSDFLDHGGIINFVMEGKKVRFEVNLAAAERAGLKIRAKLLRLAKRVIRKDHAKQRENKE